jgi:PAS domain S-box-containing protein
MRTALTGSRTAVAGAPASSTEVESFARTRGGLARRVQPTNHEIHFDPGDIIVSKTDTTGRITYANTVFCQVSGFMLTELVGAPHSLIRHPTMPRAVFKLLWDMLLERREVFAYVKNLCKDGDFYWVLAHVTPSFAKDGKVIGYHSNRRVPDRDTLDKVIIPLYAAVLREEAKHRNGKDALAAGYRHLTDFVQSQKVPYDELIFSI